MTEPDLRSAIARAATRIPDASPELRYSVTWHGKSYFAPDPGTLVEEVIEDLRIEEDGVEQEARDFRERCAAGDPTSIAQAEQ